MAGKAEKLKVLRDLDQRRLTTDAAAQLLRLERRQVFRLLKAYRIAGVAGLISKRPKEVRSKLSKISACYPAFHHHLFDGI